MTSAEQQSGRANGRRVAMRLSAAGLLLNVLLIAPWWVAHRQVGPEWVALEAVAIPAGFALLAGWRRARRLAWGIAVAVVVLTVVAIGNTATLLSLGRSVNVLLDLYLLEAVHHLLTGVFGSVWGTVVLGGLLVGLAGLAWAIASLLSPGERVRGPHAYAAAGVLFAAVVIGAGPRAGTPVGDATAVPMARLVAEQVERTRYTLAERERFGAELETAPEHDPHPDELLSRLRGTDVLLAFLESYGVSAVEDARYAPVLVPRLREMEERLTDAGLHLASGTVVAPTWGGQSWLAHGTVLSGLWVDSQHRYDLLVASGREGLVHDFRRAGHRTAAVMPAITQPWPEGERFGYDEIFDYHEMGYRGPSLNWVTMPDQYTWWFLEKEVRRGGEVPLFAVLALISSHAPWTPILPVLEDWEEVGDGSVFEPWEDAGTPPEELWLDTDRVREHYALSVDYAVHATVAYAERFVDDRTLLIALGDHQPAPLVTGEDASLAVPVHVISGDPALVQPFLELGFDRGALPGDAPPLRMDEMREWLLGAFSE